MASTATIEAIEVDRLILLFVKTLTLFSVRKVGVQLIQAPAIESYLRSCPFVSPLRITSCISSRCPADEGLTKRTPDF